MESTAAPSTVDRALQQTYVIIPMLNELDSIGLVLADLPPVNKVIVVDNGSNDGSPEAARDAGADVILEPQRGYGKACLTGIARVEHWISQTAEVAEPSDPIIVFIDGDYSDHPEQIVDVIKPIVDGEFDFVIGSRATGTREKGAMHFQAIFGNWLACSLMKWFWKARFTDLGPFRAIRYSALQSLEMADQNFGWTIEMQIKAVRQNLRSTEVPVSYRCRIGTSKISGTVSGTIRAGYKILLTIFKYRVGFA